MTERSSARRLIQSHRPWFWGYIALSFLVLMVMMFVLADRASQPRFEPAVEQGKLDNEFIPEDRSISECISAVPKPGCGSEARGGWRQTLVLAVILAGLALIAWRVVVGARRARGDPATGAAPRDVVP